MTDIAGADAPATSTDATAECTTCREPIHAKAKKCKVCDSYQDWRSYLNMSASVLALVVALVSVLSFAAPVAAKLMAKDHSEVSVALHSINGSKAVFTASNSGNKAGTIAAALLEMKAQGTESSMTLPPIAEPPIVQAGETRQVTVELTPHVRQLIQGFAPKADGQAQFDVEVIEFGGTRDHEKSEVSLNRLRADTKYRDPRCRGYELVDPRRLTQLDQMFAQQECGIYRLSSPENTEGAGGR